MICSSVSTTMDLFSILAGAFVVVTVMAIFGTLKSSSAGKNLPLGSFGWPVMGETVEFLFGKPEKFVFHRMRKYSADIFKTKIMGEKTAVICGASGHKFIFSNEQKLFTAFRPHSMRMLFRTYDTATKQPTHMTRDEESKIVKSPGFLRPEALVRYLAEMDTITQQHMEGQWEGRDKVNAFPLAKTLTLTLASRLFLGTEDPERIARLVTNFDHITVGMHSIPLNLPWTIFGRAQRAATAVRKELVAIIQEKRKAIASGALMQDVLSHMVVATDPSGKYMPEAEIAVKCIGLLVASYSSVATAMTFFIKYVGENPHVYAKVLAEQMEVAESKKAGELLCWDDVQKMKYSWNVINEVMRLTPPIQGTFRETLTDVTYAGYTIPRGWKVYWTVSSTNRNPEYFEDPDKFDPIRHENGNSTFPAFTLVPFGGGPRMCPGKEYARLAILTFVHNVVKRFRWEVLFPEEKIVGDMTPSPQKGLPIRLHRH